jgi:hypothetical protein
MGEGQRGQEGMERGEGGGSLLVRFRFVQRDHRDEGAMQCNELKMETAPELSAVVGG